MVACCETLIFGCLGGQILELSETGGILVEIGLEYGYTVSVWLCRKKHPFCPPPPTHPQEFGFP